MYRMYAKRFDFLYTRRKEMTPNQIAALEKATAKIKQEIEDGTLFNQEPSNEELQWRKIFADLDNFAEYLWKTAPWLCVKPEFLVSII